MSNKQIKMKNINQIAFSAIVSALSIVLMFLGSLISYSTMLIAFCCGFFSAIVVMETTMSRAYCSYFIVVVLAMFFIARKTMVLNYALFGGFYPILEYKISKIKSFILKAVIKTLTFCICSFAIIKLTLFIAGLDNSTLAAGLNLKFYFLTSVIACFCYDFFCKNLRAFTLTKLKLNLLNSVNYPCNILRLFICYY